MFNYTDNVATCNYYEYESLSTVTNPDVHFEIVWDLIDGYQDNWQQFMSKVKYIEEEVANGKQVIVVCRGGLSRSNAVVLAYFLRQGMEWEEAYNKIRENPESMIEPHLLQQIKEKLAERKD